MKKLLSLLSFAIVASVSAKEMTFKIGDDVKAKFPNAEFKLLVACGDALKHIDTATVAIGHGGLKYDPEALCTFLGKPLNFVTFAFAEKADFGRLYSILTMFGKAVEIGNYPDAMTIEMVSGYLPEGGKKAKTSIDTIKTPEDARNTFNIVAH